MHIPSERVYQEMQSEAASLWVVPANAGAEIAFLVKAPTSAIKALIAGCSLDFLLGKIGDCLCHGVRIKDSPDAPLLISGAVRIEEEHLAIDRLIQDKRAALFLFNEMDVCLAWTNLKFNDLEAEAAANLIGDHKSLYEGPFDKSCSHALDCFCFSTDVTQRYPNASMVPLVTIRFILEPWRTNANHFVGVRESHVVNMGDLEEGEIAERAIWASLESVFPLTLYKSPQVEIGKKARELTDVLSFHEYGCFLIESKDFSVLRSGYQRSQDRRISGVQKQARKAIRQLVGASKAISRGERILDQVGGEIEVVRDKPAHCIVLITELEHSGDWSGVEKDLIAAMQETGAFFHVVDLRELITLLKGSSGDAALLDYNLMERCKRFVEVKSVHIRSQVTPDKSLHPTPETGADEL